MLVTALVTELGADGSRGPGWRHCAAATLTRVYDADPRRVGLAMAGSAGRIPGEQRDEHLGVRASPSGRRVGVSRYVGHATLHPIN
jgi:hypothetical protein